MTDAVELNRLRDQVGQLHDDLHRLAERDPDQEVWWRAKPVIEAAIEAAEKWVGKDLVVKKMRAMLLPREEEDVGPVRAADLVPLLGILKATLGPKPATVSSARQQLDSFSKDRRRGGC